MSTYLSIIESKKQKKPTSRTEVDLQIQRTFWQMPDGRGLGGRVIEVRDWEVQIGNYRIVMVI